MNEITREIVKKIDNDIEEITKENKAAKIGEIVQPFIKKYAQEAGIDEVDLFIDYMDHAALTSKNMAMNSEGEKIFGQEELDKQDFKLY